MTTLEPDGGLRCKQELVSSRTGGSFGLSLQPPPFGRRQNGLWGDLGQRSLVSLHDADLQVMKSRSAIVNKWSTFAGLF